MNSNYTEFKFPQIKAHPWNKVFRTRLPQEAIDLVSRMLAYSPERYQTALSPPTHPYHSASCPFLATGLTPPHPRPLLRPLFCRRIKPIECCAHPFFDELRDPATRLPNGRDLPPLFNFTDTELRANPTLNALLVPAHARAAATAASTSSATGEALPPMDGDGKPHAVATPAPLTQTAGP